MVIDITMVVIGWMLHHVKVLIDIRKGTGELWLPSAYIKNRPWAFIGSILGTVAGAILTITLYEPQIAVNFDGDSMKKFTYLVNLFAVGLLGDMIADKISSAWSINNLGKQ